MEKNFEKSFGTLKIEHLERNEFKTLAMKNSYKLAGKRVSNGYELVTWWYDENGHTYYGNYFTDFDGKVDIQEMYKDAMKNLLKRSENGGTLVIAGFLMAGGEK